MKQSKTTYWDDVLAPCLINQWSVVKKSIVFYSQNSQTMMVGMVLMASLFSILFLDFDQKFLLFGTSIFLTTKRDSSASVFNVKMKHKTMTPRKVFCFHQKKPLEVEPAIVVRKKPTTAHTNWRRTHIIFQYNCVHNLFSSSFLQGLNYENTNQRAMHKRWCTTTKSNNK